MRGGRERRGRRAGRAGACSPMRRFDAGAVDDADRSATGSAPGFAPRNASPRNETRRAVWACARDAADALTALALRWTEAKGTPNLAARENRRRVPRSPPSPALNTHTATTTTTTTTTTFAKSPKPPKPSARGDAPRVRARRNDAPCASRSAADEGAERWRAPPSMARRALAAAAADSS